MRPNLASKASPEHVRPCSSGISLASPYSEACCNTGAWPISGSPEPPRSRERRSFEIPWKSARNEFRANVWCEFGPSRHTFDQARPNLANRAKFGQTWAQLGQFGANFGQVCTKFKPISDHQWFEFDRCGPNFATIGRSCRSGPISLQRLA